MKRNISVNIFGTLYHIDEDAYELLQKYNENMRRYYSSREDGEEIADDVEHRVAELLSELQSRGVLAITIDHVKEIIERIGDPQEMDDKDNNGHLENDGQATRNNTSNDNREETHQSSYAYEPAEDTRKLFRDPDDKILGGVVSGASHYLGISDPLLPRILVALLFLASFSTLAFIYILAWILIPEAVTPEDRLRMRGKPVSAKAINEELMRGLNNANQFVNNPQNRDTARGCLSAIAKFCLFSVALFFIFILGMILLGMLGSIAGISIATIFGGIDMIEAFGGNDISFFIHKLPTTLLAILVASAFLCIGIPLYALIRMVFSRKDGSRMNTTGKVALIILWFLSIGVLVGAAIRTGQKVNLELNEYQKNKHTRNGIFLSGDGWNLLDRMGWEKVKLNGINKYVSVWGELPSGRHGSYVSLMAEGNVNDMKYDLGQKRVLTSGIYKVEADVRADGEGNALYVLMHDKGDTLRVNIPTHEQRENDISEEEVFVDSDVEEHDWTHVEKTFTIDQQEEVTFGISNERQYQTAPWNGEKIEIAHVRVVKVQDASKTE